MRFKIDTNTNIVTMQFSYPDEKRHLELTKDALTTSGFDVRFTEYATGATLMWKKPYGPEGLTYWEDKRKCPLPN